MNLSRRDFITGAAASVSTYGAGAQLVHLAPKKSVTFLAFSDIHYFPGVFPHDSHEWLERVLDRAERHNVDFVIHVGDLTHNPVKERDYVKLYNDFKIPTYHTLGNHDTECCTLAETLAEYRMERGYFHFDRNGFRFVVLDTNYFRDAERFVHFEYANHRKVPPSQWWTCPEEQYEWLEETLMNSPCPCVVFMHQSCEREHYGMQDWKRMRGLFSMVNSQCRYKVRLVVNGHHHTDGLRFIDGVAYLDLNSANYKYYHEGHMLYPDAYRKTHTGASHVIAWEDPISAVISLDICGWMKIEGQKSSFFMGISPEMAGLSPRDRPITPNILSIDLTMHYGRKQEGGRVLRA